jgi:CubicO group peptidase (beta-lactamase class C family)
VLVTLPRKAGPHGKQFFYASPNTDLAGLVVEQATGVRLHEYLGNRLWKPMGAFGASWITVDRAGTGRAAGGMCVTPRDLARFGQLILDGGRNRQGEQVIPESWIADMHANGDRQAWLAGDFRASFPEGRYRSFWYETGDARGSFCGMGIHGQWLWVDPQSRVVLVRTSSRPEASDEALSLIESDLLGQIARLV